MARSLGDSAIQVGAVGLGCWAIGGEWTDSEGNPLGWGEVDDDESVVAIRRALELGANFFDTADVYGAGRSERVLGRALAGHRDEVVIATKWGNVFDESSRTMTGADETPEYARKALHASLSRLGTDYVDLYQLHLSDVDAEVGARLRDVCEEFVAEGLIRGYAWSTDDQARARVFTAGEHCVAVQHECSVLHDAPELLALCEESGVASINRSPLAMGLLTGKYTSADGVARGDIRGTPPGWLRWFTEDGASAQWVARAEAVREVLTSGGRTLAQGAIGWLWARSPRTVPIPGFRSVAQVEQNVGALDFGPLTPEQMKEIEGLLARV
ncbi:aldo/keto reductase [Streptomyces sp. NPDC088400]|uniref:aldo/keto reductase n=1 Tax=Streptomyces sp. NPDC088400 TaxID=3365861 RepID=UPI00381DB915